jgi:hypothetical protein
LDRINFPTVNLTRCGKRNFLHLIPGWDVWNNN